MPQRQKTKLFISSKDSLVAPPISTAPGRRQTSLLHCGRVVSSAAVDDETHHAIDAPTRRLSRIRKTSFVSVASSGGGGGSGGGRRAVETPGRRRAASIELTDEKVGPKIGFQVCVAGEHLATRGAGSRSAPSAVARAATDLRHVVAKHELGHVARCARRARVSGLCAPHAPRRAPTRCGRHHSVDGARPRARRRCGIDGGAPQIAKPGRANQTRDERKRQSDGRTDERTNQQTDRQTDRHARRRFSLVVDDAVVVASQAAPMRTVDGQRARPRDVADAARDAKQRSLGDARHAHGRVVEDAVQRCARFAAAVATQI